MKLFSKYNRSNIILTVVLLVAAAVANFILVRLALIHELDEALRDYKDRLELYTDQHNSFPPASAIDETYIRYEAVPEKLKKKYSLVNLREPGKDKLHVYRQLRFSHKVNGRYYAVTIAQPLEGTTLVTKIVVAITVGLLLIVIILSLILNRAILSRLWQPFYQTIAGLKDFKIGKGNKLELPDTDIDEFRFLNSSITHTVMLAEQEYSILKEFTENASHEMQTPLAIVRSKLDLVIQQEGLSDAQAEALQSAYAGIKRLNKLNRSLLLLAKIENRQFETLSHIDLEQKTEEKLEQLQEIIQESSLTVTHDLEPAYLQGNETLVDLLLNNLFSNAIRYNVPKGSIGLVLRPGLLQVSNTGTSQELDQERLFRRFYKARQHTVQNGLGLSIIKQICDQSGITIRYQYAAGQHTFVLSWQPEPVFA